VEVEEKAKLAVKGNFSKDFPVVLKTLLEQCHLFIRVIRSHFVQNTSAESDEENVSCDPLTDRRSSRKRQGTVGLKRTKTQSTKSRSTDLPRVESFNRLPIKTPVTRWRCFKCTVLNTKGDKCNMCGEPKPLLFEPVVSPVTDSVHSHRKVNTKWICTCCKFINSSQSTECEMCNQPNFDLNVSVGPWVCPHCSLNNNLITNKCNMCGKPRNNVNVQRSASSPHMTIEVPQPEAVLVSKCSFNRKKIVPLSDANIHLKYT